MDLDGILTPLEAWKLLSEFRRKYTQTYDAAYSGDKWALRRTARVKTFWRRPSKQKIHVPLAADIAQVASDLLFSEEPKLTCVETAGETAETETAERAQRRLEAICRANNLSATLCEAAESASAIGGVFLRVGWDTDLLHEPFIDVCQGDSAWPEYRGGVLRCVHIFTELSDVESEERSAQIVRVCEQYLPDGTILSSLFTGDSVNLGREEPEETLRRWGYEREVRAPVREMLAAYIPNVRPNRLFRASKLSRSDVDSQRDLLDALDEAYSSWARDIRLAKARLIVPMEYLRRKPKDMVLSGEDAPPTFEFDEDVETLVALDVDPEKSGSDGKITPSQFAIRAEEHMQTCQELITRIVTGAGYAPQTFGLGIEGMAQSGTALHIREKKSFSTASKKQTYWQSALENLLTAVVHLDAALYPKEGSSASVHVHVRFADASASDLSTVAGAVEMLYRAQAASIETRVALLHPDWSEKQRDDEAARIKEQFGTGMPEPDASLGDFSTPRNPDRENPDGQTGEDRPSGGTGPAGRTGRTGGADAAGGTGPSGGAEGGDA